MAPASSMAAAALEKFRQSGPNVQVLHLPSDFSTAEGRPSGSGLGKPYAIAAHDLT
jgi:hypothetical protein